jgi:hypothetical protein
MYRETPCLQVAPKLQLGVVNDFAAVVHHALDVPFTDMRSGV